MQCVKEFFMPLTYSHLARNTPRPSRCNAQAFRGSPTRSTAPQSNAQLPFLSQAQLHRADVGFQPLRISRLNIRTFHVELVGTQYHGREIQPDAVRVLIRDRLRQNLLVCVALNEISIVRDLVRTYLVPHKCLVLRTVEASQAGKDTLRKSLATQLQGVLDVDKRHGFGGLALLAVTH